MSRPCRQATQGRDPDEPRAHETYRGFKPVHMAKTLAEDRPDLAVSARTLRRILAAGVAAVVAGARSASARKAPSGAASGRHVRQRAG